MAIQIAVLIKPVPDLSCATVSKSRGLLIEKGPRIMRPSDRNALEFALQLAEKEKGGALAPTVIAVGPVERPEAERFIEVEPVLREAMALGADRAILLSDPSFLGGDETTLAAVLAGALAKLKPDLVLCGEGQVGPRVAEALKIRSVYGTVGVRAEGGLLSVDRKSPSGTETRSEPFPLLLSIAPGSNTPRIANALKIMKAAKKEIVRWDAAQIGVSFGPGSGAGLQTLRVFSPEGS